MRRGPAPAGTNRVARRGAALVELVLILPILSFIFVASADFARAFHDFVTVTDCARNGAIFASQNPTLASAAYQAGISSAALADAGGLNPTPTVSFTSGSLGTQNNYVSVTVSSAFRTLSQYPGIPSSFAMTRTIQMRVQPTVYRMK